MNQEEHPTDLLPAYALGIVDSEEKHRVADHIASCPECQAELSAFTRVTGQLALGLPEAIPPAGLRRRVLADAIQSPAVAHQPPETSAGHESRSLFNRLFSRPVWQPVAAVLILLLVISNLVFWQRVRRLESQTPPTPQAIIMGGTDAAPDAGGVILFRPEANSGTLVVNGLAPLNPDQQYQLWLVRGEERDTGAIFSVESLGTNSIPINAPQALTSYSRFGITIEPAGGSPGPTGDGVLRSSAPDTDDS